MSEIDQVSYPNIKQGWGIVGITILILLLFSPISILLKGIAGDEIAFFVYYVIATGAAFWFAHAKRRQWTGAATYNFHFSSVKLLVLVGIATVAIQVGLISPITSSLPMPDFMEQVFVELANRNGFFAFVTLVVAAPLLEELIFRGIVLDGFLKKYSPSKAIIMSSFFFGIIHLNPWQFTAAMIIGIFSGWIYYRTRSLTLPILIHSINNLIAYGYMVFWDAETLIDMSLTDLYGGIYPLIGITCGALVIAAVCLYYLRSQFSYAPTYDSGSHGGFEN